MEPSLNDDNHRDVKGVIPSMEVPPTTSTNNQDPKIVAANVGRTVIDTNKHGISLVLLDDPDPFPTMNKRIKTVVTTSNEATEGIVSSTGIEAESTRTASELNQQPQSLSSQQPISKNQLKKRRRIEKAILIKQRKKQQKKQVRYERAKAQGRDIDLERQQQEVARLQSINTTTRIQRIQEWQQKYQLQIQQSYQICIDCSFESYMTPKEINSLAIQIRYCYSSNKRSPYPCQLTATSIGCNNNNINDATDVDTAESTNDNTNTNASKNNTNTNNNEQQHNNNINCMTLNHLQKVNGFEEWSNYAFHITSLSFDQYYHNQIQNLVYLTSDSDNIITTLDNTKIYIIGGIVDRNRYKQLTYHRAMALNITTAKLPIDTYLSTMPSTRVLTTNHVFDLLLKYKVYNGDWKKALTDVLPIRKDAKFVDEDNKELNDT